MLPQTKKTRFGYSQERVSPPHRRVHTVPRPVSDIFLDVGRTVWELDIIFILFVKQRSILKDIFNEFCQPLLPLCGRQMWRSFCTTIVIGWYICSQFERSEKSTLIWKKGCFFPGWQLHFVWKYSCTISSLKNIFFSCEWFAGKKCIQLLLRNFLKVYCT